VARPFRRTRFVPVPGAGDLTALNAVHSTGAARTARRSDVHEQTVSEALAIEPEHVLPLPQ